MEQARELLRQGRLEELRQLIAESPPAQGLHLRAALQLAQRQPRQALASVRESLALESSFSQRNTLAVCLLECGQAEEARSVLRDLLESQPDNADLWYNLARAEGGTRALREALRRRPGWRAAELLLVARLRQQNQTQEALALVRRDLSSPAARLLEAEILFQAGRFADCVALCLGLLQEDASWSAARLLLFQAVTTAGEFVRDERLADELEKGFGLAGSWALVPSLWRAWPARQVLLVALLHRDLVADWPLEQWLTRWRRDWRFRPEPSELAEALAVHNFTNEFSFLEDPDEIEGLTPDHPAYSLYRPLPLGMPGPAAVVERHLEEPARERQLAARLEPLPTADAVTEQYEQNPYPRWRELEDTGPPGTFHQFESPRVLVAGGGTGRHALLCARRYLGARVWAVDVSAASLAYAWRQAERLGFSQVRFLRGDLLHLDGLELPAEFELIESVGVLHHLQSPLAGLRALVGRLCPNGWMRLGLYSRRARAGLEPARQLARRWGRLPLRELRSQLVARLEPKDLQFLIGFKDFYSLSGLRDLLLHEREQEYDLPQVAQLLAEAGLQFAGFDGLPQPVLQQFTTRFGRAQLNDLNCWDSFEQERHDTFRGMYLFWCRR